MIAPEPAEFFATALARVRDCRRQGDLAGAARELRAALDGPLDYPMVVKAAAVLREPPPGLPVRRVALVGEGALALLRPVLTALAFRDGWIPEFYETPAGAWRQEILTPRSQLRRFAPEVTLVLRSWRETNLPAVGVGEAVLDQLVGQEGALVQKAANGLGLVLWPSFDLPSYDVLGALGGHWPGGRRVALAGANTRLRAALPPGVGWVELAEVQAAVGAAWVDERFYFSARQFPSAAGVLPLAELWLALLRARWGQTRKVLVTDLDNTLWGGVAGEDGFENLRIDPGDPVAEAHAAFQQYLAELKARGVLLAVCSKNNEADAAEVFSRRAMPLKREDFAGWAVNWDDKAANLKALARDLKLGLDSFVFVDNDPAERARVRAALPEVAVPELPADPAEFIPALARRRFFETLTITEDDLRRPADYRANQERTVARQSAATLDDFLEDLEMTCEHEAFHERILERLAQLEARSNQWNLTTRRHLRADLAAFAVRPDAVTQAFRLRDRFGDCGLVGHWMAVARPAHGATVPAEWELDTWLMSCRVIGRGLEFLMFNVLVEMLRARGAARLRATYRPTAKNPLVAGLLSSLGFRPAGKAPGDGQYFLLELAKAKPSPHHLRHRAAADAPV